MQPLVSDLKDITSAEVGVYRNGSYISAHYPIVITYLQSRLSQDEVQTVKQDIIRCAERHGYRGTVTEWRGNSITDFKQVFYLALIKN